MGIKVDLGESDWPDFPGAPISFMDVLCWEEGEAKARVSKTRGNSKKSCTYSFSSETSVTTSLFYFETQQKMSWMGVLGEVQINAPRNIRDS